MDVRAHLLEPLFVTDPKALLFIYNQKPKVFDFHLIGQNRMGPNHDIYGAARQAFAGVVGFFGADES